MCSPYLFIRLHTSLLFPSLLIRANARARKSHNKNKHKCGNRRTKYIYDDKNDLWYELQGDYYIPCLILPAEKEQPIGLWGQRHLQYLKEYRRITYLNLLTSGRLNTYLADIDKQTEEMFFRLVEQMKQAQGIMEQLKAENALEWTGRLNNIRACAREIVERKIIFA